MSKLYQMISECVVLLSSSLCCFVPSGKIFWAFKQRKLLESGYFFLIFLDDQIDQIEKQKKLRNYWKLGGQTCRKISWIKKIISLISKIKFSYVSLSVFFTVTLIIVSSLIIMWGDNSTKINKRVVLNKHMGWNFSFL